MPDRTRRGHRSRTAVTGLAAWACAGALALTGCSGGAGGGAKSAPKGAGHAAAAAPAGPVWNRHPGSVAAVGDSMTRGFDACSVLADCPEVSWATGTDRAVRSLAARLLGPSAVTAHSWNHAVSGARIAQLPEQMAQAARERPELVTVMIGANDACRGSVASMTPVEDFRFSFDLSLRQLRAAVPKAQVYVSSVPDLWRLWSTGRRSPLGKQVWKLGICKSMLADADDMGAAATARRAAVRARVVEYNTVLREVCAEDELCRYDGDAVFHYPFTGAQLSPWDWFHPGRDGQARLAEIAYRNVTAPAPPA
ncbi:SGNH/GDSL hydrolase family protein [Streptomyces sp. NPDC005576]|uniref:SGNH/GDSL hydrolase family protein n=1 Tax=Streptomyces sp. NPDC005576 TaxID=3364726 RepID=UPI00369F1F50